MVLGGHVGGLQSRKGNQLDASAWEMNPETMRASGFHTIRSFVGRCEGRVNASTADEDVGGCCQFLGEVNDRLTVGGRSSWLQTFDFKAQIRELLFPLAL